MSKTVVLYAGEYYFSNTGTQIYTLLGSCVSITLWHPVLKIGGMCHFALPYRHKIKDKGFNPRFGDDCMTLFKRSAKRHNTALKEYQAKIFGGGNILGKKSEVDIDDIQMQPIGDKNVVAAYEFLSNEGLDILVAHVGEFGYRQIVFDITTGGVWVKFTPVVKQHDQSSLSGKS